MIVIIIIITVGEADIFSCRLFLSANSIVGENGIPDSFSSTSAAIGPVNTLYRKVPLSSLLLLHRSVIIVL